MRGRQPVQSSEINYHIDHVLVAKIEVMCVMNQSWKGFWCVVIVRETESSVAQPARQRALCEESVSKQKILCDATREGILRAWEASRYRRGDPLFRQPSTLSLRRGCLFPWRTQPCMDPIFEPSLLLPASAHHPGGHRPPSLPPPES